MELKGTHVLTSGNSLEWVQDRAGASGSLRAAFEHEPDAIDRAEAEAFCMSMIPPDAEMVGEYAIRGVDQAKQRMDEFLYGGSQN